MAFAHGMNEKFFSDRLTVKSGDLTDEAVDAIVNAANSTLLGGGGVDGAIHRRGGAAILDECRRIRETRYPEGLPTGEAVITTAGHLPARFVIHTVGPVYGMNQGRDADLLEACYRNSIELAVNHGLSTISFPSISTGVYGYPKHEAAPIVFSTMAALLEKHSDVSVALVFFSESDAATFLKYAG